MAAHSLSFQQRLGSHSRSTPNFATIKEDSPQATWTSPKPHAQAKRSRGSPGANRKPTFTAGAPSEPVSAEEDEDIQSDSSSLHSGSSFERDLLSRSVSYSDTGSASDSEHDVQSNRRSPQHAPSSYHDSTSSRRPLYSHTSRSQSYLGPSAFAPPFYNRPPTPLPPSPSLTSLLRPRQFAHPFSPSRPTTPDSSDTEATHATSAFATNRAAGYSTTSLPTRPGTSGTTGGGTTTNPTTSAAASTAGLVAASALTSPGPVPRASPKLPTNEYYGFVVYLGSSLAFFLYLLWSYLPTPFLHQLGIYYYPDRWWSLAVPSWLVVALCWTYVALSSYNTGYLTLPLGSLECLVDAKGQLAIVDGEGKIIRDDASKRRRLKDARTSEIMGTGVGQKQKKRRVSAQGAARRKRDRRKEKGGGREGMGGKMMPDQTPRELDWRGLWNEGTDAVMDVPIGGVCEVLYGAGREELQRNEVGIYRADSIENG